MSSPDPAQIADYVAARMTWRRRLAHFSGTFRRRVVFDNSRWGRHLGDDKPLCQVVVFEGRSSWVACGQPLPCPEHNDGSVSDAR